MEDGQGGRRDVLAPGHPQEHRETSAAAGVVAARGAREPGRALAGVVLYGAGVLAVAAVAARAASHVDPYLTARDVVAATSGDAAFVVVLVVAAALASGRGAWTLAVAVLAWAAGAVPTLGEWAAGGPDLLLVSALASGAAAALAWAWRPLRRAALGT